jgi:cation transport ATPase
VLVDALGRVAEAIEIGRDTRAVARTGIVIGMGLSAVLMVVAAFGGLAPLHGAVAQEAIDVVAILNALRALSGGGLRARRVRALLRGGLRQPPAGHAASADFP